MYCTIMPTEIFLTNIACLLNWYIGVTCSWGNDAAFMDKVPSFFTNPYIRAYMRIRLRWPLVIVTHCTTKFRRKFQLKNEYATTIPQ